MCTCDTVCRYFHARVGKFCLFVVFVCVCVCVCVCVLPPSPGGRRFIRAAGIWTPSDVALNFKLQTFLACACACVCVCVCVSAWVCTSGMWVKHMWALTCIRVPSHYNLYLRLWYFGLCVCVCVCVCVCILPHGPGGTRRHPFRHPL